MRALVPPSQITTLCIADTAASPANAGPPASPPGRRLLGKRPQRAASLGVAGAVAALNSSTWALMASTPPMKRVAASGPRAGPARRMSLLKRALNMQSVSETGCGDRETDEAASALFELSVSAG